MRTSEIIADLCDALAKAQAELKNPGKTKTAKIVSSKGNYSYAYADIADVLESALPVLGKHGLSVIQPTKIDGNAIILVTRLSHASGQWIESDYPVCSLNGDHKAMGSAMTYARRYALTSLIGLAAVEDTDGEGAAKSGEGERVVMSVRAAKTEINWEAIQKELDDAPNLKRVAALRERVESRRGVWPGSYVAQALDRLARREAELLVPELTDRMQAARSEDELNDALDAANAALDAKQIGRDQHEDIKALYWDRVNSLEAAQ